MNAMAMREPPFRLAVVADYREEGWPSMDLTAEMFLRHTGANEAEAVCPPFRRRLTRLPLLGRTHWARNADRLLNRLRDYPRHLARQVYNFDLFHICDHSYAQLVHVLPADRTGVFLHDLDTFACLLDPARCRRPRWFRAMSRHILRGLQKAAVVFHATHFIREEIERLGLLDMNRLARVPLGVATEFTSDSPDSAFDGDLLRQTVGDAPFLLHVGSCVPRKRIDVLLEVFAAVRERFPRLQLVQIGGHWTPAQLRQAQRLRIADAVRQISDVAREVIAAFYRRAACILQTSESEGFGLPVIEALACGGIVVASDIPALREAAGQAALYCPVGDVSAWSELVLRVLHDSSNAPPLGVRLARAARYSWDAHTLTILQSYWRLLQRRLSPGSHLLEEPCELSI